MAELPSGTVTFLFTDLESSTRLWEEFPDSMKGALARHDALVGAAIAAHGGLVVKTTGDGFHAVFTAPSDALGAAVDAQRALGDEAWGSTGPLRVRMGVHTGVAELREGDYYGSMPNRSARLMSVAHGGQIVCSHATATVAGENPAGGVTIVDLGEHRLRDLSQPEHVFQVGAAGLQSEFPPLTSLDAQSTNLPVQLTSFLGRDAEVAEIAALCVDHALVTITGVGGVGKTRLALQAAAEALPEFPDGVWLCELAPANDPGAVVEIVAEVLDARPRPGLDTAAAVVEVLVPKRLLLVLDNCEHVLDAAADLVFAIVSACPEVRILATSREGLAVDGERVRPLRSLAVPADDEGAAVSSAVLLFAERAQATRGSFVLDEANVAAVVEICRRLDGIPLAIELAAARVVAMQPGEIASHLDERFRLLTGNRRRAIERHQTLRATVEWSYSLLTATERSVFDRLSVFAGSFDVDAATAVTSDEDIGSWEVLDAIESLVAKSMVNAEDRGGATRYSMLETLRSYARERLESGGEADEWRRRQAAYFVAFANDAGHGLKGPDEIKWFGRIRDELDNLRTAVFWSLDAAVDHSHALEIISSLAMLASLDRSTGLSGWADQAIDHLDETTPGRGASVLGAAAWYAYDRADFERSEELATRALTGLYEPDCLAPTLTLIILGLRGTNTGAEIMAELREHMARLDAAEASETDQSIFRSSVATMCIFFPDEAANVAIYAQQGFALAQSSGNPSALAAGYFALGGALAAAGEHDAARAAHESSIALTRGGATDGVYPHALRFAARACFRAGDFPAAAEHSRAAIEHADRTGDLPTLRYALDESTFLLVREGRFEAAAMILGNGDSGEISRWNMPWDATGIKESEQQILAELGEEACDAARARGLAMNQREIVVFALNELSALDAHP